ncbi:MAG: HD domain-containing protein [Balneolaceae bacterium]|nr:HD domain-containing protein [Balneolaceae bacterium]MBO6546765.1 HD domain-containing protein [Balneolaceae bacterium]MBO6649125.1 HD domain-containing protein [Balneolaceae bacterium]
MPELLKKEILKKTEEFVKGRLEGDSGHDWWHIHRVRNIALHIAKKEQADLFIVELAVLLHDVADHKFHDGDETIGAKVARDWLLSLGIDQKTILHVCQIIKNVSFKGANVETSMQTIEGKIVQDADRLDAMGAIGIARAFSYGGYRNRELYNPNQKPTMHSSFDEYKKDEGHTINHFYEKLFLLKNRMNTATGKSLAEERHQFMQDYVDCFLKEWDGK